MSNLRKFEHILNEGISQEDLANTLCHRIEMRYPDIYKKYDYDAMYNAVDDVASFHAGREELGNSDINIMIRQVFKRLEESEGVAEGSSSKLSSPFEGGKKTTSITPKHKPLVWENMLGTVMAKDPTLKAEPKYFDYRWEDARAYAKVDQCDDLRICKSPGLYQGWPEKGKMALWGIPRQGVAEGLEEAVGGNYLYHGRSVYDAKEILASGYIPQAKGPQKATQAQTKLPTVSVTRDWGYASGSNAQTQMAGIGRDVVFVLDRNAVESNFKTLGTSQSQHIKGLALNPYLTKNGEARSQNTDSMARANAKGKSKYAEPTAKAGGEFEEAVVVPKGALPLKGTMVGFWVNPKSELAKDPAIMNDPRRLDMVRPNQFVKATQQQGVAEEKGTLWRVHQSEATGRYHVVKGYNKDIKMYKNKMGAGDFNSKDAAQAKADELNKGIEEGWKQNLAAAGAAGLMALGGGGAHAGGVTLGGGGHTVDNQIRMNQQMTQQVQQQAPKRDLSGFATEYLQKAADPNRFGRFLVSPEEAKAELAARESGTSSYKEPQKPAPSANNGFSKEYLEKAADPNRFGRYLISIEKAQELLKQMNATNEDQLDELKCWDGHKRVPGTKAGDPGSCEEINEIFNPTSGISSFLRSASNFISDYVPVLLGVGGTFVATSAVLGPVAAALASSTVGTQIFQTLQNQQNKVPGMIQQMIEKYVGSEQEAKEFMLLHAKTAYLEKPEFRWRGQNWPVTLKKDQAEAIVEKFDKLWLEQHLAKEKESGELNEYSTDRLARYKTAAPADARAADKARNFARGNKRFAGIVKATKKQFDNETKPKKESAIMKGIQNETLGTPYPGTYEQEYGPFKRKGQERTMKIAFEGKNALKRY